MGLKQLLGRLGCLGATPPECPLGCQRERRAVSLAFKVVKKIAEGSCASVYLVERLADGKRFALKQTAITELEEPLRWVAVNEIRVMASLDPHPHVVDCKEGFVDGNYLCIILELMPNGELASTIQRHAERDTLIPEADIWTWFIEIALGVKHLHRHGIIHRDLKPQNVLIGADGHLKIADLGVAHIVRGARNTRVQFGTPNYMPPEIWRHDPYSFPVDIWALGCILHELCTRTPLLLGRTERDVESKVLAGVIPPISKRYSQELWQLITAMLQYDPADRPTIDEILACKAVQSRMAPLPHMVAPADESWDQGFLPERFRRESRKVKPKPLDPIEIPEDLNLLNLHLPPSRYSVGEGLVTLLRAESLELARQGSSSGSGSGSVADTAYAAAAAAVAAS